MLYFSHAVNLILCLVCIRSHCGKPYPDQDCWTATKKAVQDPPLLFNLDEDPSEVYTLTPKDPEYNDIMDTMKNVRMS